MNKDILKMIHIPQRIGKLKVNILSISGILSTLLFSAYAQANNTVTLTWDEVIHADGYQLEEKLVGDADWTKIPAGTNSHTLTDRADGEYVYRVIACIDHPTDGKLCNTDVAEYSADANVTLPHTSSMATPNLVIEFTGSSQDYKVHWGEIVEADNYIVEQKTGTADWAFLSEQSELFIDVLSPPLGNHYYQVKACDVNSNCGEFSSPRNIEIMFEPGVCLIEE